MKTERESEDIKFRIVAHKKYQEISKENLDRFEKLHSEMLTLRKKIKEEEPHFADKDWLKVFDLEYERDKYSVVSIVFAAMCLEAFIYDYAATATSHSYVKNYLDKLDLVSKWIVIPRIITGKEIPRGSKALQMLSKLVSARNGLIHFKSKSSTWDDYFERFEEEQQSKIVEDTRNGYPTISILMKELRKIDPTIGHELKT